MTMRFTYAVVAVLTLARVADAQFVPPEVRASQEAIKIRLQLRRDELKRCGSCATRALVQAQINELLHLGLILGFNEGAPGPTLAELPVPKEPENYAQRRASLQARVRQEPVSQGSTYLISEDRANLAIVNQCISLHDHYTISSLLTNEENAYRITEKGRAEEAANVMKCIAQYDAKAIVANRKTAIEYCYQNNSYMTDGKGKDPFDVCMAKHDMLYAMCGAEMMFRVAYMNRRNPYPPEKQNCPRDWVVPNPREIQAILAAPKVVSGPELPALFFPEPPNVKLVAAATGPPPIDAGRQIWTTVIDPITAEAIEQKKPLRVRVDQPIMGEFSQMILPVGATLYLKGRVIGPGPRRTVRVALTTDYADVGGKRIEVKTTEIEQSLRLMMNSAGVTAVWLPAESKLQFLTRN
jgi:hypothetical protein